MSYYDTWQRSYKTNKQKWLDGLQELVDREFSNASTYQEDIEEEVAFGTLEFHTIICRVNSLVDAKTGQRVNDDYKKIIFPDLNYAPELGTRYRFDNNIWIVFSTDNIRTDTVAVYVRRCNNTMNVQDEYGNVHREPCYIDYKITENQLFREYTMDVPSGRIWVQCQNNKYTNSIDVNDRFIFGDDAYKVRNRGRFDRRYTFDDNSNNVISFYADLDAKGEYDNIELGIADYRKFNYEIDVINEISGVVGFSTQIAVRVYLNGDLIDNEPLKWYSSNEDIATVTDDGTVTLKEVGNCEITVVLTNNTSIMKTINISVVSIPSDNFQVIIDPQITTVPINYKTKYTVYEYNNGIKTDTTFAIAYDTTLSCNYFKFETDNQNTFYISNLKTNRTNPVKVICISSRDSSEHEIEIYMGGVG